MIQRYNKILILFLLVLVASNAFAQQIKGVVTDSITHEPLMYISVYYQEKRDMGTITNIDGEYSLDTRRNGGTLVFSAVGYISKTVRVGSNNQTVNVKLAPDNVLLNEVVVKPQKEKYSRKNNPAVEFMKKVIEHKKAQVLEVNEYYQYDKYEKMKMSINDLTPEKLEKGIYKKYSFLRDQVEVSETTNNVDSPYFRTGNVLANHLPQKSRKQENDYQRKELQWYRRIFLYRRYARHRTERRICRHQYLR